MGLAYVFLGRLESPMSQLLWRRNLQGCQRESGEAAHRWHPHRSRARDGGEHGEAGGAAAAACSYSKYFLACLILEIGLDGEGRSFCKHSTYIPFFPSNSAELLKFIFLELFFFMFRNNPWPHRQDRLRTQNPLAGSALPAWLAGHPATGQAIITLAGNPLASGNYLECPTIAAKWLVRKYLAAFQL